METDPFQPAMSVFHGRIDRVFDSIRFGVIWSNKKRSSTKTSSSLKTQSQLKSNLNLYQNSTSNQSQLIITIYNFITFSRWSYTSTIIMKWTYNPMLIFVDPAHPPCLGRRYIYTHPKSNIDTKHDGWEVIYFRLQPMAMLCSFMLNFRGCKFFFPQPKTTNHPYPTNSNTRCPGGGAVRTSSFYRVSSGRRGSVVHQVRGETLQSHVDK